MNEMCLAAVQRVLDEDRLEKTLAAPKRAILTTSENPDDREKAIGMNAEIKTKPLTPETLEEILGKYPSV